MVKISLLPEKKRKLKGPPKALILTVAAICLGIVLLGYLACLGYKFSLKSKANALEEQIERTGTEQDKEVEREILNLQKRMTALKGLISSHAYWSDVFKIIEEQTIPEVQFEGFQGDLTGEVNLEGRGDSYTSIAKQLVSFLSSDEIEDVDLSDVSLTTEGGIQFGMSLDFKKEALLKKEP